MEKLIDPINAMDIIRRNFEFRCKMIYQILHLNALFCRRKQSKEIITKKLWAAPTRRKIFAIAPSDHFIFSLHILNKHLVENLYRKQFFYIKSETIPKLSDLQEFPYRSHFSLFYIPNLANTLSAIIIQVVSRPLPIQPFIS